MKVRPAGGLGRTLAESMEHVVELDDWEALLAFLRCHYDYREPTTDNTFVEPYGYDQRIDWNTHLVLVGGHATLFTDGPMSPPLYGPYAWGPCAFCGKYGDESTMDPLSGDDQGCFDCTENYLDALRAGIDEPTELRPIVESALRLEARHPKG